MVWTSPRTWMPGEKPGAEMLNTQIRDNLRRLPVVEFGAGFVWGDAFNPALHQPKVFADTVVGVPSSGGDVTLIDSLPAHFVGVASAVASFGDITTGREVIPWVYSANTLVARIMNSAGTVITTGGQRVNFTVFGWVAI